MKFKEGTLELEGKILSSIGMELEGTKHRMGTLIDYGKIELRIN
jgi:hypothetical protein